MTLILEGFLMFWQFVMMMKMMTFECWLASRASNLITVITGGIQLALTGLSDPHHSYTRTITLVNIFVFLYFCICVLLYLCICLILAKLHQHRYTRQHFCIAYFCICVFVWSSPHHYTRQNFRILYLCFCICWILATDTPAILDL